MKRKSEEVQSWNRGSRMAGGSNANGDASPKRVCRDFLRNVCHRGKRCKYLHERSEDDPVEEYTFCHDFQNGLCHWPGCKFLHCSESEEKHFRATGELPAHILNRIKNGSEKPEYPVCKDFVKGSCQRLNCKFLHYKKDEPPLNIPPPAHLAPSRPQHSVNGVCNGDNHRYEEERK